ncbi:MAG: hypothetical protein KDJ80_09060 [Nitratireductor sp.]|nr:hypothetical protein [Nitratireductor sp.]
MGASQRINLEHVASRPPTGRLAETVLGHTARGSVERAYRRTDYLDQRRTVMEAWGEWVAGR